ncbi:MAG: hypothetical protein ACP5RF_01810 [Candidatus Micrarchaeia archaeon]
MRGAQILIALLATVAFIGMPLASNAVHMPNAMQIPQPPEISCPGGVTPQASYTCVTGICTLTQPICANTVTISNGATLYTGSNSITALYSFTNYGTIIAEGAPAGLACSSGSCPSTSFTIGSNGINQCFLAYNTITSIQQDGSCLVGAYQKYCSYVPCTSGYTCIGTSNIHVNPNTCAESGGGYEVGTCEKTVITQSTLETVCGGAGGNSYNSIYNNNPDSAGAGGGGVGQFGGVPAYGPNPGDILNGVSAGGMYSGGAGSAYTNIGSLGSGGYGGGSISINATNFYNYGNIIASGSSGSAGNFPGGGGGGGAIIIKAINTLENTGMINASGGNAGAITPYTIYVGPNSGNYCANGGGGGGGVVILNLTGPLISGISTQNCIEPLGSGTIEACGGYSSGNALCGAYATNGMAGTIFTEPLNTYTVTFNAVVSGGGNFDGSSEQDILTLSIPNTPWSISLTPLQLPYTFVVANNVQVSYSYPSSLSSSGGFIYTFNSIEGASGQSGTITVNSIENIVANYIQSSPQCTTSGGTTTCIYPQSIEFQTYYSNPYCSLYSQTSTQFVKSPTNSVNNYNSNNAIYLLTAPYKLSTTNPTDSSLFIPSGSSSYIGGDECLASTSLLNSVINYDTIVTYSGTSPASAQFSNFNIDNIGNLFLNNFGYSPMVDNSIANGFQTNSYIFYDVPSFVQHGIWSWSANFANFNNVPNLPHSSTASLSGLSYTETLQDGDTCTYSYSYSVTTTLDNVENYVIPFNEVITNAQNSYVTFNTPILPYLIYNFSMPSPGSILTPMSMSLSYDTFGPWNYFTPSNSIDMFPIDTGSRFFVSYKGVLENENPSDLIDIGKHMHKLPNMHNLLNLLNQQVSGPISIAATQNDYVYVLNYSQSSGDYYITILRLIPKGYYNTSSYQPDSVQSASSKSEWFSNWDNYWNNVISIQNESVYAISSINLDTFNNSFLTKINARTPDGGSSFKPLNISVDNFGDIYITGFSLLNVPSFIPFVYTTLPIPGVAEITNTLVNNNWAEAYNSIFPEGFKPMSEIAVSPTGGVFYVASETDGGYVFVYSGSNMTQINKINLAYENSVGGYPTSQLNLSYWLSNNGLYNQSIPSSVLSYIHPNKPQLDIPEYHHPLGLADINGYLYVLDSWAGSIGLKYTPSFFSATDSGVFFDMLTLRVFNSTGSNIPINANHFNDMFAEQACGPPTNSLGPISPNACFPAVNGQPDLSSFSCSNNCIQTGIQGICKDNEYQYECIAPNTNGTSSTYYSLAPAYGNSEYPPYGWILAANITGAELSTTIGSALYTINSPSSVNFCGGSNNGNPPVCNFNPVNLNPSNYNTYSSTVNYYNGTYYPIGPELDAIAMNASNNEAAQMSDDVKIGWAPEYNKIGFSVNFNDSINILFPNTTPINPIYDIDEDPITNPNMYRELISTTLNVENYTKLFGGLPPYTCYINSEDYINTICGSMPSITYMNPPIYTAVDALKYLEALGSPQMMTYEGTIYSSSSGGMPRAYSGCANVVNSIENGQSCGVLTPNTIASQGNTVLSTTLPSPLSPFASAEYLDSNVSGYALIPYKYTYTLNQNWYDVNPSSSNPSDCPSNPLSQSTTNTQTVYSYEIISNTSSNFLSTIEGGATYLRFLNNKYYVANLSDYGTILSKNILFNMFTDRNFSSIYVNTTSLSNDGYYQTLLNASFSSNFIVNTYNLGSNPAFETISSVPINPWLFGNGALSELTQSIQNKFTPLFGTNAGFFYGSNPTPAFVNLFDWYKSRLYTNPLNLYLNMSSFQSPSSMQSIAYNTKGYTRLVYVLNDKFNNTIYVPLDADIANITTLNLAVNPIVNATNQNQTQLVISGNATYFNGVKLVPLVGNTIYLYYGADINYVNYNPFEDPANAILCTYGTNSIYMNPSTCVSSNPAITSDVQNSDVLTYYPSYNSMGVCNPPPNTLFSQPANNCNIYGNILPQSCNTLAINIPSMYGPPTTEQIQQWCVPQYANGTGTCTSQIGLMGIVTTNSIGGFSLTANTCGIGQASIIAEFYGYPYGEPITVSQPYLGSSGELVYNYYNNQVNTPPSVATFQALNYSWSPNETLATTQIGLAQLSYGSITVQEVLLLLAITAIIALLLRKR